MARFIWTLELVKAEARKYKKVTDFKYGSRGAYDWAERNGVVKDVTDFMMKPTDPDLLFRRFESELFAAYRNKMIAKRLMDEEPFEYAQPSDDPEEISAGTYMDFEVQMFDQTAEERSDKALDCLEALKEHGTPQQIHEAWVMYLQYQAGTMKYHTGTSATYVQGEEQGGSCE